MAACGVETIYENNLVNNPTYNYQPLVYSAIPSVKQWPYNPCPRHDLYPYYNQTPVYQQDVPQPIITSQHIGPQQIALQQSAPQQSAPQQIAPQQIVPQQIVPQQIVPQQIVPQQIVPQQIVPQQIVPQQIVPQQIVPQQIVPQQIVPQQIVPQQIVPQQIVQQKMDSQLIIDPQPIYPKPIVPQKIVPCQIEPPSIIVPQKNDSQQNESGQIVALQKIPLSDTFELAKMLKNLKLNNENAGVYGPNGSWYPLENLKHLSPEDQRQIFQNCDSLLPNMNLIEPNNVVEYVADQNYIQNIYDQYRANRLSSTKPILLFEDSNNESRNLAAIWTKHFIIRFKTFEEVWLFSAVKDIEEMAQYISYKEHAKVRYYCQKCRRGWTSMHGTVLFYYRYDQLKTFGEVKFKVFRQQCHDCDSDIYYSPAWYPEEAERVMENLYVEINRRVYNKMTGVKNLSRRFGKPIKVHISSGCEGCALDLCKNTNNYCK